jgi:alanine dehydrogenase
MPAAEFLAEHDIIVNCTLQDPNRPLMFLAEEDLRASRPGSLIIDVSCDEGMGFDWARPTSFKQSTFVVGDNICYYAVDHSPSYLWNSATWVISEAVLPYLHTVMAGREAWAANETIWRAIEVRDGIIQNPAILSFQGRAADYPHSRL